MGLLSAGSPLDWDETKKNVRVVHEHGAHEFLKTYAHFKDERNYPFKWGDEIEFSIVRFDHENKRVQLSLRGEQLLERLHDETNPAAPPALRHANVTYHPEYASYMIESTPKRPFDADLNSFKFLEDNMASRRRFVEELLDQDEAILAITNFPRIGCPNFTSPSYTPNINQGITRSYFFPDAAIFKGHPRFRTLSNNIRERKGKTVSIQVPVFVDKCTKTPFREETTTANGYDGRARDNFVFMDATGFGMGCCCLQTTFQAESIDEARHLYDQLTPITPLLLSLTAASPIWRGYLTSVDCRWNVISASVDDRTDQELGLVVDESDSDSKKSTTYRRIHKSRYDSIDSYLSEAGARYNDIELVMNEQVYEQLIADGVDVLLARHIAHLFIRDPLVLFKERVEQVIANGVIDDDMDFFENIQSTNWQTMRFKPPPLKNNDQRQIGWRVEFRPMELQITDFENSAFCAFVILLTQAIRQFNLNFLMPLSKVDVNMQRAQTINSCLDAKFYFRKNVEDGEGETEGEIVEMSVDQIMNGTDEFRGLIPIVEEYVMGLVETLDSLTSCKIKQFLKLIRLRAQGTLMTPAAYVRSFVTRHPAYKHDSVVNEEINYDLLWRIHKISKGEVDCPELFFKLNC